MSLCWGRSLQVCCRRSWCQSLISASLGSAAQEQHQGISRNKCFANGDVEKHCCGCNGTTSVLVTWVALEGMSLCVCMAQLGIWRTKGAKKIYSVLHMVPFWSQIIKQEYHLPILGTSEQRIYTPVLLSFHGSTKDILARSVLLLLLTDIGVMEVVLQWAIQP